jgi:intein/homing endonuclease
LLTQLGGLNGLRPQMPPTLLGSKEEEIPASFQGYVEHAYRQNGIVFACMLVRMMLFSEARFQFRRLKDGRPGELFGTEALSLLEKPWAGATTGDLLSRAMQDADLAGNFFATVRGRGKNKRIVRLRPDWVTIMLGSYSEPKRDIGAWDLDTEVIGYVYQPGGKGGGEKPEFLERDEVVHFAPIPDPLASFRGMSWLTPVLREIMGDKAATTHKLSYFENGASPNLVVSFDKDMNPEELKKWLDAFEENHAGAANAFRTLILASGASADKIGSDMKEVDFKKVQAAGENRIAVASGISGIIVGLAEGLESATYCMPADQPVWTLNGPRPIAGLKVGERLWSHVDGELAPREITWQGQTGELPVYTIRTKNRALRATGNHPMLVRVPGNSDGSNAERHAGTEWRQIKDLSVGDQVVQAMCLPEQGRTEMPDGAEATEEKMRWLGAFIGDGCLDGDDGVHMCIPAEDRVRGFYEAIPPRIFTKLCQGQWPTPARRASDGLTPRMVELREQGLTFRQIRDEMGVALSPMSVRDRIHYATRRYRGSREPVVTRNARNSFRFNSKQAVAWHKQMGVTGLAKTKRVPGWVFGMTEDLRLAFLAGVVDTDGSVGKDGRLQISFANRDLTEDIRMLLVSVGVQCSNISSQNCTAKNLPNPTTRLFFESWRFVASSAVDVARIPFADSLYRERVDANQHRQKRCGGDAANAGLDESLGFFAVTAIEEGGPEPVFDIEVAGGHSFLAGGVIAHNSNYGQARRRDADVTMRPLWRKMAGSFATIVDVPPGAELWYDDRDVSFLQEDLKDEAEIQHKEAITIRQYVDAGFTPESAVAAVESGDLNRLVHTGLFSVQLQPPGSANPGAPGQYPALPSGE